MPIDLEALANDPHPILRACRETSAVLWVAELDGWLVTGYDEAAQVLKDSDTFTVQDGRFSTARLTGESMLTVDGAAHSRHRGAFAAPYRPAVIRQRLTEATQRIAGGLVVARADQASIEVVSELAQPLAIAVLAETLGLPRTSAAEVIEWHHLLAAAFEDDAAGRPAAIPARALDELRSRVLETVRRTDASPLLDAATSGADPLSVDETVGNLAIMMIGGVETVEGMIAHAVQYLWRLDAVDSPDALDEPAVDRAIEESLRIEPAAARLDRYATRDIQMGTAQIHRGDLVMISISGANRDPRQFDDPDRFDPGRANLTRQLGFALGPHYCLGVHLARLEAREAIFALRRHLPDAHLDVRRSDASVGLIFRKPRRLTLAVR